MGSKNVSKRSKYLLLLLVETIGAYNVGFPRTTHKHTNIYLNPVPSVFSSCSSASMPKHSFSAICSSYRKWQFACLPLTFREDKWNRSSLSFSANTLNHIFQQRCQWMPSVSVTIHSPERASVSFEYLNKHNGIHHLKPGFNAFIKSSLWCRRQFSWSDVSDW